MSERPNRCIKCGALETELAKPECKNPIWHLPNLEAANRPDAHVDEGAPG